MKKQLFIRTVSIPEFSKIVSLLGHEESQYLSTYKIPEITMGCIEYPWSARYLAERTPVEYFELLNREGFDSVIVPLTPGNNLPDNIVQFINRIRCKSIMLVENDLQIKWVNPKELGSAIYKKRETITDLMPTNVSIGISTYCNLRCRMCRHDLYKKNTFLEYSKAVELLELFLANAKKLCVLDIGETFIHPRVNELYSMIADKYPGVKLNLVTNGIVTLDKSVLTSLAEKNMIDTILISINAATRTTYKNICGNDCFDKVLENAKMYAAIAEQASSSADLCFSYVAQKDNLAELPDLVDIAKEVGVKRLMIRQMQVGLFQDGISDLEKVDEYLIEQSTYINKSITNKYYQLTMEKGKNAGIAVYHPGLFGETKTGGSCECNEPWTTVNIDTYGNLRPCCYYPNVGNIFREGLMEVWNGEKMQELRRTVNGPERNEICRSCWYFGETDINDPRQHFNKAIIERYKIK